MFFRKKHHIITWDDHENLKVLFKIVITINAIQPFKNSFLGIKNSPASFDFVPNALQVLGTIRSTEGLDLDKREVLFLVPEENLSPLNPGESIVLWLCHPNKCFKLEKLPIFDN